MDMATKPQELRRFWTIRNLGCAAALLLGGQWASAIKVPPGLDRCRSLQACMRLLETVVPDVDDGEGSNAAILARDLARFGEPAKRELLDRAVGPQPGWRNVAGAILGEWKSWDASDVAKLREALRKDPGGLGGAAARENWYAGSDSGVGGRIFRMGAKVRQALRFRTSDPR